MDDNRVEGAARDIGGKVQDAVGGLAGDASTQVRGKVNQAAGQAQNLYGQAMDGVTEFAKEEPITALLTAVGVGLLLGFVIARR